MSSSCNESFIPRFVSESRLAQGFPERVENPAALARVATLLAAAGRDTEVTDRSDGPVGLAAAS